MIKRFIFVVMACLLSVAVNAQDRLVARGADAGELYFLSYWYGIYHGGPPFYDTLQAAIYRISENGKKISIQYNFQPPLMYAPEEPDSVMIPNYILADATPGVIYTKCIKFKNDGYTYMQLWVSFDYGKKWTFREENIGSKSYFSANVKGLIYRGGTPSAGQPYKSIDYGINFDLLETNFIVGEPGFNSEELFFINGNVPSQYKFWHTHNLYQAYTEIPIDSQFMFGNVSGYFPDVYRGGKAGEVYIMSMFPEPEYKTSYKISFSADTGQTFRHVFVSENYSLVTNNPNYGFMSDREPGVFYITRSYQVEDTDPWGWHTRICIEYYRDYGETLVGTYCHDLTREGVVTRIDEVKKRDEIVVYPNPTEGQLRITNYELRITNIEVFDVFGRSVKAISPSFGEGWGEALDISHLPSGMYFVRITTENGTVTKKIVKR